MSLDGFISGPNGEIDWITMGPESDFAEIFGAIRYASRRAPDIRRNGHRRTRFNARYEDSGVLEDAEARGSS